MEPSPTAEATRLTEPCRTSPTANTPGRLISSSNGTRRKSLAVLRDAAMILDSFARIDRALPGDPAQAIGSAKELVEATAKTVLLELGVPFDGRTAQLPSLVDAAQRALLLHPQQHALGPDGTNSVKRILGGLMTIALGLGELRNDGWGTGHAAHRVGLRPRHAHLAVNVAQTWRRLVLDTLADPEAPWRRKKEESLSPAAE
jgi:hypothetical protein